MNLMNNEEKYCSMLKQYRTIKNYKVILNNVDEDIDLCFAVAKGYTCIQIRDAYFPPSNRVFEEVEYDTALRTCVKIQKNLTKYEKILFKQEKGITFSIPTNIVEDCIAMISRTLEMSRKYEGLSFEHQKMIRRDSYDMILKQRIIDFEKEISMVFTTISALKRTFKDTFPQTYTMYLKHCHDFKEIAQTNENIGFIVDTHYNNLNNTI